MSDKPPISIALIGSGIFAREQHLPAILATPSVSLKAVYSRTLESVAKLTQNIAQKIDFYSDETASSARGYDDLLANAEIEGVIIALPIPSQPAYIRKALEAGKHVLAEKPIAADSSTAAELLSWYTQIKDEKKCTWSIAENRRFLDSHVYAAEEIQKLGRVMGFRARSQKMINPGDEYFETAWRKNPEYQGGFILDAGIHEVAAIRYMLGPENDFSRMSAFVSQLQEHLPPVDTVNAIIMTNSGVSGGIALSFGSTFKGRGYAIACERGTVTVVPDAVAIETAEGKSTQYFPDQGSGVQQEMRCWAESVSSGVQDPRLSPEEALKDLKIIEAMLLSGKENGVPVDLTL